MWSSHGFYNIIKKHINKLVSQTKLKGTFTLPLYVCVKDIKNRRNLNTIASYLSQIYLSNGMEVIFQGYQSINLHKSKNKAKQRSIPWRGALLLILFIYCTVGI